jgi:Flp pilus assembly protein TadG
MTQPLRSLLRLLRRLAAERRGGPAVEFAISGTVLFGFMLGIIDLGLLGMDLGALTRAVQATGRWAAVQASASYGSGTTITEPCASSTATAFNGFATPALPALPTTATTSPTGTINNSNVTLTTTWTNTAAGQAPGVYVTVTGKYKFVPGNFNAFGTGFSISITTAATVLNSAAAGVTVGAGCT